MKTMSCFFAMDICRDEFVLFCIITLFSYLNLGSSLLWSFKESVNQQLFSLTATVITYRMTHMTGKLIFII